MKIFTFFRTVLGLTLLKAGILVLILGQPLNSQVLTPDLHKSAPHSLPSLSVTHVPRVADPKLEGGDIPIHCRLWPKGATYQVTIRVMDGAVPYREIFSGSLQGAFSTYQFSWDGKDVLGNYADPGDFMVVVEAERNEVHSAELPVTIVRLGITEIEAFPGPFMNEWQMVYFRKANSYEFYATPASSVVPISSASENS